MARGSPHTVAKILESRDRKRRVLIIARDSVFGLGVQKLYQNVSEGPVLAQGWASLPTHKSIYESIEIAEREARAQFEWLA